MNSEVSVLDHSDLHRVTPDHQSGLSSLTTDILVASGYGTLYPYLWYVGVHTEVFQVVVSVPTHELLRHKNLVQCRA